MKSHSNKEKRRDVMTKNFISTVTGTLTKYYKDPRSTFGTLAYPVTWSRRMMTKEDIEKYARSNTLAGVFQDMIKGNSWSCAMRYLSNYVENYLPPPSLIKTILDTMLVADDNMFIYNAEWYISRLIICYPPKTDDMAYYYWEIFMEEESEPKRVSSPKNPSGSFLSILELLESELKELDSKRIEANSIAVCVPREHIYSDLNEPDEDSNSSVPDSIKDIINLCNESIMTGKYFQSGWEKASCEQRIHRILIILSAMNEVFMMDLDVWKNRSQEAKKHPLARPIISRLLWPHTDADPHKARVKDIVSIYALSHKINLLGCSTRLEQLIGYIAMALPSNSNNQGIGHHPDSHQRRVFTDIVSLTLNECNLGDKLLETALGRLYPDWFRLNVCSKIHRELSNLPCGDVPLNVVNMAKMIEKEIYLGNEATSIPTTSGCPSMLEIPCEKKRGRKRKPIKRNAKGETRLHTLARTGNSIQLSKALETEGENINVPDYAGWTPMHDAIINNQVECVRVLCQYKQGKSNQETSSNDSGSTLVVNLHAAGGDVCTTPLHEAVFADNVEMADLLLKFGGPSLLKDVTKYGATPLDLARSDEMKDLLEKKIEECRTEEKKWIFKMQSNVIELPYDVNTRRILSLRFILLHSYLEVHCLVDLATIFRSPSRKVTTTQTVTLRGVDYLEMSHDIKSLLLLLKAMRSTIHERLELQKSFLVPFLL